MIDFTITGNKKQAYSDRDAGNLLNYLQSDDTEVEGVSGLGVTEEGPVKAWQDVRVEEKGGLKEDGGGDDDDATKLEAAETLPVLVSLAWLRPWLEPLDKNAKGLDKKHEARTER